MVNFVTNPGLADDMQQWGQYWGGTDQRAQQRWQDNEVRRRYDEASRLNLDEANSSRAFMAANADAFNSMDPTLAGLNTQDAPIADVSNGADPSTLTRGLRILGRARPTSTSTTPSIPEVNVGVDIAQANQGPIQPLHLTGRNSTQQDLIRTYEQSIDYLNNRRMSPEPFRRNLDALVRARVLTQEQANAEFGRVLNALGQTTRVRRRTLDVTEQANEARNASIRAANPGVDFTGSPYAAPGGASVAIPPGTTPDIVNAPTTPGNVATNDAGLSPDTSTPAPLDNGPTDPYGLAGPTAYQGTNDTSRGLQPTREMRLLQISVRDNLRRADIAAAHGNTQVAQAAFAQALQGHATYINQARLALYHAALAGSNDAMTTLFSEFSGVPSDAVRLQPTNETRTRFNLQIRNNQGQWVTSNEVPQTRQEILGGLQNLVDAAGAQARTEANTQILQHQIDAGARIQEATIQQRTAILRMLADAAIARGNNQTAVAIQNGNAHVTVDSDGGAWVSYSITDAQGRVIPQLEHVNMQDVPTPATDDGNRTIRAPVVQPANGSPNAGVR